MPTYTQHLLNPANEIDIDELHAFLEEQTEEGENDTREIHEVALKGLLKDGKTPSGIPYFAEVSRNSLTNAMASTVMCGLVPTKGGRVAAITYCYTAEDDQREGLATLNYNVAIGRAKKIAEDLGEQIQIITAEASSDSREFFESVGLHRVYYRSAPKEIREISYIQSALEDGGEEVPEHLMIGFVDKPSPKEMIERLIAGAHAIQAWSSPVDTHEAEFEAQFRDVENLLFLTRKDILKLRAEGIEVIEFTEADEE